MRTAASLRLRPNAPRHGMQFGVRKIPSHATNRKSTHHQRKAKTYRTMNECGLPLFHSLVCSWAPLPSGICAVFVLLVPRCSLVLRISTPISTLALDRIIVESSPLRGISYSEAPKSSDKQQRGHDRNITGAIISSFTPTTLYHSLVEYNHGIYDDIQF